MKRKSNKTLISCCLLPVLKSVLGDTKTPHWLLISETTKPLVDLSWFPTPSSISPISFLLLYIPLSFSPSLTTHLSSMEKQPLGLEITELRLGLPGNGEKNEKKRAYVAIAGEDEPTRDEVERKNNMSKGQVVGWPPVCSYRRKNSFEEKESLHENKNSKIYVKISMDGAPFLRKLDLGSHNGYSDLALALEKLFACFGTGKFSALSRICFIFSLVFTVSIVIYINIVIM